MSPAASDAIPLAPLLLFSFALSAVVGDKAAAAAVVAAVAAGPPAPYRFRVYIQAQGIKKLG